MVSNKEAYNPKALIDYQQKYKEKKINQRRKLPNLKQLDKRCYLRVSAMVTGMFKKTAEYANIAGRSEGENCLNSYKTVLICEICGKNGESRG